MNDIQRFRTLNFSSYFGIAALGTMTIPFLLHRGFTPSQVGVVASFYTLSGFISNYIMGYLCDRLGTIKKIYTICVIAAALLMFLMTIVSSKTIFIPTYILLGFFQSSMMNLSDSWVMEHSNETRLKYGTIRSFGSIGWSLCSLLIGYLIEITDFYIIGVVYISMTLLLLYFSKDLSDSHKEPSNIKATDFLTLFSLPNYGLFILCLFMYGIAHASVAYIPPYLIQSLGGTTSSIGLYSFICSGSEIIILALSVKLLAKKSAEQLFLFASLSLLVRFGLLFFANSLFLVYVSGIFHMFSFGVFLISSKQIINKLTPTGLKTTGQMLWAAIFVGLGTTIASSLSGVLIQKIGIKSSILVFTSIGIVATILLFAYNQKVRTLIVMNKAS